MGLFGKLFDKKICDICGGEIGLLGNRKLEDGDCCKDCAALLSPFMTDRKHTTVEEIRAHIAYREANRAQLPYFRVSRVLGEGGTKIYFDDEAGRFMVTPYSDWPRVNPDVIDIAQVMDCQIDIRESRTEEYDRAPDGSRVRFDPPRFKFSYTFEIIILVDSPWFDRIEFTLSGKQPNAPFDPLYHEYERIADEIRMTLLPGAEPVAQYLEPPKPQHPGMAGAIFGAVAAMAGKPIGKPEPPRPAPQPVRPEPPRPAPQPARPEPPRPSAQPARPTPQPARPAGPSSHPAGPSVQPVRPSAPQPAQPKRPSGPPSDRRGPLGPNGDGRKGDPRGGGRFPG